MCSVSHTRACEISPLHFNQPWLLEQVTAPRRTEGPWTSVVPPVPPESSLFSLERSDCGRKGWAPLFTGGQETQIRCLFSKLDIASDGTS